MSAYHPGRRYRFFNDIFSTGIFGGFFHTMRAFYDGDTYLALPLYFQFIDEVVSLRVLDVIFIMC